MTLSLALVCHNDVLGDLRKNDVVEELREVVAGHRKSNGVSG
jgi:hypothetical protein